MRRELQGKQGLNMIALFVCEISSIALIALSWQRLVSVGPLFDCEHLWAERSNERIYTHPVNCTASESILFNSVHILNSSLDHFLGSIQTRFLNIVSVIVVVGDGVLLFICT
jgi:hypothetical protein